MAGLSLYPKAPDSTAPLSTVERLGAKALGAVRRGQGLMGTLLSAIRAASAPGGSARSVCREIAIRQIFYTSVQALGLISVVAVFIGASLIVQTELLGGGFHREMVGRVLIAVVLRELAPLVTAIILAGRSGTAMATELGVMRVGSEVLGLASMGIDPARFLVWPRMVASIVSVPILTVYFSTIAVFAGYMAAVALGGHGLGDLQAGVLSGLTPFDLPLFLVKTLGLGTLVGWICCHYGLEVGASPTEVPIKSSQAVVQTLLACVMYNTVVTVVFYWWMGPSIR